ncbi:hypothetical protein OB2597_19376 [Pseudooceanicola batsensis HTCC2597]|uniref:Uncharacterized protein n=1 Tax=Pseudooceanicola batsensis (strain ATCC BAA-863 / DSM 15984 / KCTC 12145 / HTCC2597) TaxID=252305 RepID=A3U0I5_PSEBH|nr:hypothetical protein OB2597_19376 [Pseudooceanicola batsensis HTCC2597]
MPERLHNLALDLQRRLRQDPPEN